MSTVYGGSCLNIAAAGATDGNGGLFFNRSPGDFRSEQTSMMVEVKGNPEVFRIVDSEIYSRCVDSQPLSSRAWVLQGRILAPRTLHISRTDVFWECRWNCACDTSPDQLPPQFRHGSLLRRDIPSMIKGDDFFTENQAWQ
jgi:hypothetical protein